MSAIAYWGITLMAPPVALAPGATLVNLGGAIDPALASRLLGAAAGPGNAGKSGSATTPAPANLKVLGVAASQQRGSVVLSIDAKPPRAYMVGDEIGAGMRLLEVRADAVVIQSGSARIEIPAPPRPDTRVLSAGPSGASAASPGGAGTNPVTPRSTFNAAPSQPRPVASPAQPGARAGGPGIIETSDSQGNDGGDDAEQADPENDASADGEAGGNQNNNAAPARSGRLIRTLPGAD
jgi:general secretion pathway protein C